MSDESTVTAFTRACLTKKLLRPLSVSGIPAVQNLARNMSDLVDILQMPTINDASGRKIIENIEKVAKLISPAIAGMGDDGHEFCIYEAMYVDDLCAFSEFLKDTKAKVEEQLGRTGTSKVLYHIGIQELLADRERELQTQILHLVFATGVLTNWLVAGLHHQLKAIEVKLDQLSVGTPK
ncbi:hypothetical protein BDV93DRAFT_557244 [Ceratobasidium sp. AG-I]|nr:hypothetical protein BDV93DRAFT_557244 [Ceratobasidium sp. AG-I]